VLVQVAPHERLLRDGDDLVTALHVPFTRAALGGTLAVDGLDGPLDVEVPAGTQPGTILTVKGEGMPVLRRPGRRGDLRVVVDVVVPRKLRKDQRRLLEQLDGTIDEDQLSSHESLVGRLRRLVGHRQ
jgi:molecular chaperone DnaJ